MKYTPRWRLSSASHPSQPRVSGVIISEQTEDARGEMGKSAARNDRKETEDEETAPGGAEAQGFWVW